MKALIVYATNSGGTFFAAQTIQDELSKKGWETSIMKASDVTPDQIAGGHDLVILGSNSWNYGGAEGQMHQHFKDLHEKIGDRKYEGVKFAVYGLGDDSYQKFCGGADQLKEFVGAIGGQLVGEPMKIDRFYADQKQKEDHLRQWIGFIVGSISQT